MTGTWDSHYSGCIWESVSDEIRLWICRLNKAGGLPQCMWASSSPLEASIEQKAKVRENSVSESFWVGILVSCAQSGIYTISSGSQAFELGLNMFISSLGSSANHGTCQPSQFVNQFLIINLSLSLFHYTHTHTDTYIYVYTEYAEMQVWGLELEQLSCNIMWKEHVEKVYILLHRRCTYSNKGEKPAFLTLMGLPCQPWTTYMDIYMAEK